MYRAGLLGRKRTFCIDQKFPRKGEIETWTVSLVKFNVIITSSINRVVPTEVPWGERRRRLQGGTCQEQRERPGEDLVWRMGFERNDEHKVIS